MIAPPLFAAGLVLAVAAAGSGDYILLVPGEAAICAKSRDTCEAAREAIRTERWPIAARDAVTSCRPSPGCFSARSLVIPGYNGK